MIRTATRTRPLPDIIGTHQGRTLYAATIISTIAAGQAYGVEFQCACGRKHRHGMHVYDVGRPTHRLGHCQFVSVDHRAMCGSYWILTTTAEFARWRQLVGDVTWRIGEQLALFPGGRL